LEAVLEMRGIKKSFHGIEVLKGVDFHVEKGEVHALCGENGAGKSTLMKIIAGVYQKDGGTIHFDGKELEGLTPGSVRDLGISVIHQELNLLEDLTVAQNLFFGREPKNRYGFMDEKRMKEAAVQLLSQLEYIDPAVKVKTLGVAKKQIIEIAKALSYDTRLIIMDEPTAVLTNRETELLFDFIASLKQKGVSIIFISHRLNEIRTICDRVTVLRDGHFCATKSLSEVSDKEIVQLMVGREIGDMSPKSVDETAPVVLKAEGLSCRSVVKNVSFSLRKGEILGIAGLIGAGRTELAEIIFGIRRADSGTIQIHGKQVVIKSPMEAVARKIGFATEDRKKSGLMLTRSIRENVNIVKHLLTRGNLIRQADEHRELMLYADKFNLKYNSPEIPVIHLSGGNQQKIVLAKWMASDAEIFILDEPTRGVDVGARKEIYEQINALTDAGKSVIVISSDLPEILGLCQRIVVMREGAVAGELSSSAATEEAVMMLATGVAKAV